MTIHIGLIGGGITETHARAVRAVPGVEIAATYGENSGKVAALCGQYGGRAYHDLESLLDLILWLVGDVVRVQASKATAFHTIEGEDTAVALLEFAAGALGVLQATTAVYPGYPRRLEITGSEGTVILEHDRILSCDLRTLPNGFTQDFPPDGNQSASSAVVSDARGHQDSSKISSALSRRTGRPFAMEGKGEEV